MRRVTKNGNQKQKKKTAKDSFEDYTHNNTHINVSSCPLKYWLSFFPKENIFMIFKFLDLQRTHTHTQTKHIV